MVGEDVAEVVVGGQQHDGEDSVEGSGQAGAHGALGGRGEGEVGDCNLGVQDCASGLDDGPVGHNGELGWDVMGGVLKVPKGPDDARLVLDGEQTHGGKEWDLGDVAVGKNFGGKVVLV